MGQDFLALEGKSTLECQQEVSSGRYPPCIMYKIIYTGPEEKRVKRNLMMVDVDGANVPLSFSCLVKEEKRECVLMVHVCVCVFYCKCMHIYSVYSCGCAKGGWWWCFLVTPSTFIDVVKQAGVYYICNFTLCCCQDVWWWLWWWWCTSMHMCLCGYVCGGGGYMCVYTHVHLCLCGTYLCTYMAVCAFTYICVPSCIQLILPAPTPHLRNIYPILPVGNNAVINIYFTYICRHFNIAVRPYRLSSTACKTLYVHS